MVTVHIAKVLEMNRNTSPCPSETGLKLLYPYFISSHQHCTLYGSMHISIIDTVCLISYGTMARKNKANTVPTMCLCNIILMIISHNLQLFAELKLFIIKSIHSQLSSNG